MYYLISLFTGTILTIMIVFNGALTDFYGVYFATVIIHIVGMILIAGIVLVKRENPFKNKQKWYLYIGGAIGVFITVSNNVSFGRISVSAILALMLFGQSVMGIVVDSYGLFGIPKHPFAKYKLIGLSLVLIGIISMISDFEVVAVIFSFFAGVFIVVSRTIVAKLSDLTSVRIGTFFNYVVGLIVSTIILLILGRNQIQITEFTFSPDWYIYLGGVLGVCAVTLTSITVVKISALYITLLVFVGQVFSGVLIDVFLAQEVPHGIILGGILVACGLCIDLLLDKKYASKASKKDAETV